MAHGENRALGGLHSVPVVLAGGDEMVDGGKAESHVARLDEEPFGAGANGARAQTAPLHGAMVRAVDVRDDGGGVPCVLEAHGGGDKEPARDGTVQVAVS